MYPRERSEEGSVLIMALIFITVMGVVVGALVNLAGVDMRNSNGTRQQRQTVYAADGAVQTAINTYRQNPVCPLATQPPASNGTTVTVTCSATPTSPPGGAPTNVPPFALMALNTAGEGINGASSATTSVIGGVYSGWDIDFPPSSDLAVTGNAYAKNGCSTHTDGTFNVTATGTRDCAYSGVQNDPGSVSGSGYDPLPVPTTYQTVPTCSAGGAPVYFDPGAYADGQALTGLFNSCTGTSSVKRVFHFRPGAYYFEFTNATGTHEWLINDANTVVVGGTLPTGTDATNIATRTVGSRCNDQSTAGVQFVFGGDSHLKVTAGEFELCAPHDPSPTPTVQEIAIYGLPASRYPGPSAPPPPTNLAPPATSGVPTGTFTNPAYGQVQDGQWATATVTSSASPHIDFSGFGTGGINSIPDGSTINSATLELKHRESVTNPTKNNLALTATITSAGVPTLTCDAASGGSGCHLLNKDSVGATPDQIPLGSGFLTKSALQGLSVVYATAMTGNNPPASFDVGFDGVKLRVTYTPPPASPPSPAYHAESGCVTNPGYVPNSASTCPVLKTQNTSTDFSVHGTVYTPAAVVDAQITNTSHQVFGRGLIARAVWVNVTAACAGCVSPFQLPTAPSTPSNSNVVFEAAVGTNRRLRALVSFPPGGGTPTISSWSVVNE